MARKKFRVHEITLIGATLVWIGAYMFPFGYAESFHWCMVNLFEGDYAQTVWFFYAWTSAAIIGGFFLLAYSVNMTPKQILKKIF